MYISSSPTLAFGLVTSRYSAVVDIRGVRRLRVDRREKSVYAIVSFCEVVSGATARSGCSICTYRELRDL